MKTEEEILKSFTIKEEENNLIYLTILYSEADDEDNGLQAELITREALELANKDPNRTVDFLIDLSPVGSISYLTERARKAYTKLATHNEHLHKVAIVGKGVFLKATINLIMESIGRGESFKWFENLDEARTWLRKG